MSIAHGNQYADVTREGLDETKVSRNLTPPTAEKLQTELSDFVMHTRLRLTALSQSLTDYQSKHCEIIPEVDSNSAMNATQVETMSPSTEPSTTYSSAAVSTIAQSTTDAFVPSTLNLPSAADAPMDPLNAIKLRLAQQIKTSRNLNQPQIVAVRIESHECNHASIEFARNDHE